MTREFELASEIIRLRDGTMNVGVVRRPYFLKTRKIDLTRFLPDMIVPRSPLPERLRDAALPGPAARPV